MKAEQIAALQAQFEAVAHQGQEETEFWLARELQELLGYSEWRNFLKVVEKAYSACQGAGQRIGDHFVYVNKMVDLGSGSTREIADIALTRYACYLIAQNGDPRKAPGAFAQTYFAIQTRKQELVARGIAERERVAARKKLTESERQLSGLVIDRTGDERAVARIRSIVASLTSGGKPAMIESARP